MTIQTLIPYSSEIRLEDTAAAQNTIRVKLHPNEEKPWAIDFTGACPRCQDLIEVRKWLISFAGALKVNDRQMEALAAALEREGVDRSQGDETFDLVCNCRASHPGKPKDKRGCGATFRVRVTWP